MGDQGGRRQKSRVIPLGRAAVALAALAAIVAAVGACGGGGDGGADATPTRSPTRAASSTRTTRTSPTVSPTETVVGMELDDFVIRPEQTRARPGTIIFRVRNVGEIAHEFVVIKSDLSIAELPRLLDDAGVDESELDVEDRLELVNAGEEADLSIDLGVGKYVVICNLAPNGESHYLNGMYNGFEVRDDAPLNTPQPSASP